MYSANDCSSSDRYILIRSLLLIIIDTPSTMNSIISGYSDLIGYRVTLALEIIVPIATTYSTESIYI